AAQEIDAGRDEDLDVLAVAGSSEGDAVLYRLTVRGGNVVGGRPFRFQRYGGPIAELPGAFLQSCYGIRAATGDEIPPPLIVGPGFGETTAALQAWLSELRGSRVSLLVPRRGRKLQLLRLAEKNAVEHLDRENRAGEFTARALDELARVLKLSGPPEVIEGLDISHLGVEGVVASLVCFRGGRPEPDGYRRYLLEKAPPDDFARMAAVVRRRFAPEKERNEPRPRPDLLLLDGGRAQLGAVSRVLAELGISVPLVAIAKGRDENGNKSSRQPDLFYQPGRMRPLPFGDYAPARRLLQQVRDEAHRFALDYQRRRRTRERETVLLEIDGIGPQRSRKLLQVFGSVEKIAAAGPDELVKRGGLPRAVAEKVNNFLHPVVGG
ncbi:MAG: hypothetical protein GXO34_01935, partial [Deltaproteobacteria bacterium]|nr:hypothetical protein [Deltaproteobacteria bacterium]